nr:MAG TPA: hypothetical protein [Bacteriophage sp.]
MLFPYIIQNGHKLKNSSQIDYYIQFLIMKAKHKIQIPQLHM